MMMMMMNAIIVLVMTMVIDVGHNYDTTVFGTVDNKIGCSCKEDFYLIKLVPSRYFKTAARKGLWEGNPSHDSLGFCYAPINLCVR